MFIGDYKRTRQVMKVVGHLRRATDFHFHMLTVCGFFTFMALDCGLCGFSTIIKLEEEKGKSEDS